MDSVAFFNGQYLPLSSVAISPMDRGFLFGDAVYEVIPANRLSQPACVNKHLDRLYRSLNAIDIKIDALDWQGIFEQLLKKNQSQGSPLRIYVQVTRGVAQHRTHDFVGDMTPTIFAYTMPSPENPIEKLAQGFHAITALDSRWSRCDIKSTALLANVLHAQSAKKQGAADVILLRSGYVTECAVSNVFMVKQGILRTPPLSPYVLGGITRDVVLHLAMSQQWAVEEQPISEAALRDADEIWITSSTKPIYPIVSLDKQPVGKGQTGPLWQQMMHLYQQAL